MTRTASPRMARLLGIRVNSAAVTVRARICAGPQSELGKDVHVRLTPEHLPALRQAVQALEARQGHEHQD